TTTSGCRVPAHLVPSRPVRYPPTAEATHWTTTSQIAVMTVKVVAEAPRSAHGETEARPKPEPSASRMRDTAQATRAPAMMAAHETADTADSSAGAAASAGVYEGVP